MKIATMKSLFAVMSAAVILFAACKKEPKKLGSHTVAIVFVGGNDAIVRTPKGDVKAVSTKEKKKVEPRYRNPANVEETWTGRGKQPRWLAAQLAAGKQLASFLI